GSGDMYAYIPASAFAGALPTDFVYMYVFFGSHGSADIVTGGGVEEWDLILNPALPTPTPTPTPTPPPSPTPAATPTATPTATPQPRPTPMQCDVVAADADTCYPFFGT